jgi:nucleoside diphosphate kinase
MKLEVVHVMLKPDTLARGIRNLIVAELEAVAGTVAFSKTLVLDHSQISAIYNRFPNPLSKAFVFNYFISMPTEHLVFVGPEGLHSAVHAVKGKTGSGRGIRGKYFSDYVHYSQRDIERWLQGTSDQAEEIDLEMFGRDILHVADDQTDSLRGLEAVFGPEYHEIRRAADRGVASVTPESGAVGGMPL